MARRSSNRDRIDRMRAEAEATAREKEKKAKARAASPTPTPTRSRSSAAKSEPVRLKIVWAVKNPAGKIVETFPYPLKAKAEAEADRLTGETGKEHMVRPEKVPMD